MINKLQSFFLVGVFILSPFVLLAQEPDTGGVEDFSGMSTDDIPNINPQAMVADSINSFKAAFGITQIGGDTFVGTRLQPEVSLLKVGFGLDIPIQFNINDMSFRYEEFLGEDSVFKATDIFRMIRYFRYGKQKVDPFYIRLGDMTGVSLGFGTLVNNYSNSPSFENRKFGVNLDFNIKEVFGVEGIFSDVTGFNMLAIRPYVRPFRTTKIPILKTLEFGYGYVTDKGVTSENSSFLTNGIQASNFDMGVTFLNTSFIKLIGFGQSSVIKKINSDTLAQIFATDSISYGRGEGTSFGLSSQMKVAGNLFRFDTRIERLMYKDNYIPQFFDAIYEINKDEKIQSLGTSTNSQGIYGSLGISIIDKIRITGSLLLPDQVSVETPALVSVQLETADLIEKLTLSGSYIKGNLESLQDAFVLDQRSLANVNLSYQIASFLIIGGEYRWTFARTETGTIEATDYFRPYFALNFPFGGGKNKDKDEVGE